MPASQAGRREFESPRPLQTPGDDTRRLLASCFTNSATPKALRDQPFPPPVLPPVDTGGVSCHPWTAFRHRVGHPRAPRAASWSPSPCSERTCRLPPSRAVLTLDDLHALPGSPLGPEARPQAERPDAKTFAIREGDSVFHGCAVRRATSCRTNGAGREGVVPAPSRQPRRPFRRRRGR